MAVSLRSNTHLSRHDYYFIPAHGEISEAHLEEVPISVARVETHDLFRPPNPIGRPAGSDQSLRKPNVAPDIIRVEGNRVFGISNGAIVPLLEGFDCAQKRVGIGLGVIQSNGLAPEFQSPI